MKKANLLFPILVATLSFGVAACRGGGGDKSKEFSFSISLNSGKSFLTTEVPDSIKILTTNPTGEETYTFTSSNTEVAEITSEGVINPIAEGNVTFIVQETKSLLRETLPVEVRAPSEKASGGYNFANATNKQARTEILSKLEKYAMESHLTGITLFENGGYVLYSDRVKANMPTPNYITGYGFGILSEGDITEELEKEENPNHKLYLHSAMAQEPTQLNHLNATGSDVSDLAGYITSSYWGTKMNLTKTGYDWYPVLAKDTVNGQPYTRPTAVYETPNPLGLYKTWKIYVKTGADGLKYRYAGASKPGYTFENREVALEDYEFIYKLLLTGAHNLVRGSEVAGDKTYGIKGAQAYFNRTKDLKDQTQIDTIWNQMKTSGQLGIKTGTDEVGGSYVQLELLNPIDEFTAMYTLSSSLYSPIPQEFIEAIGDGDIIKGAKIYGTFNNRPEGSAMLDYVICLGAYYLEGWNKQQSVIFKQNDTWVERTTYPDRYKIKGVKLAVIDMSNDTEKAYREFKAGKIDSCGVPISKISTERANAYKTKGDATFKLNVNSCTETQWNKLFGESGTISPHSTWDVKPWMSNDNFLNGLFWSINREEFADARGVQPSINYFADSYLSDPENGVSYNSTPQHREAVKYFHTVEYDDDGNETYNNYGFNYDKAVGYFKSAVKELADSGAIAYGTKNKPTDITISINWMYQTDKTEYGEDIKKYFEDAFNDEAVCGGRVRLTVEQPDPSTNWQDVYNEVMMKGQFDLAFGAISGNTYNPLNFLEVLRSDNSSGFTLNWGPDTSKVDEKNPIQHAGRLWSFDALWDAADHGAVVDGGETVKPVKHAYMELPKDPTTGDDTNDLTGGATIEIPVEFINVPGADFEVSKVQLYILGDSNQDLEWEWNADHTAIIVTIDATQASEINEKIREVNKLNDPSNPDKYDEKPFLLGNYADYNGGDKKRYWTIEIYYTLSIDGGDPTENYLTVAKNSGDWPKDN